MCIRSRITELVLFGEDNEKPGETPLEEIQRNLNEMVSTLEDTATAVRNWEDWRLAGMLDLLGSHAKNVKAKVATVKEYLALEKNPTAEFAK